MYICSVEPEKNAKQHDCVDTQTTGKASFRGTSWPFVDNGFGRI